jgi:hypothetical protein
VFLSCGTIGFYPSYYRLAIVLASALALFATSFDFLYLDFYIEALFGRPGNSLPVSVSIIAVTAITPFDFNRGEFKVCSY